MIPNQPCPGLPHKRRSIRDLLESQALPLVLICFILAVATLNASPYLHDPIWQDEAVTLAFHASRGVLDPFLHYQSPNNHMAFSSMLAGWMRLFPAGVDVPTLRLLPMLLYLAAIPIICLAAMQLGGPVCAIATGLIFASSAISENFATQLRGYGPSWFFFSLMLWAALNSAGPRKFGWRSAYFASSLFAIAMLPTNFYFALVVAAAISIYFAQSSEFRRPERLGGFIFLLGTPVVSLILVYAATWDELMGFSGMAFSQWTDRELVQNWLRGSLSNVLWLTPVMGAGLVCGLHGLVTDRADMTTAGSKEFVLAVLLIVGFLIAILAIPRTPFPRTLVPYLPIWVCAISCLMVLGLRRVVRERAWAPLIVGLGGFAFALMLIGPARASCKASVMRTGAFGYDLCYQYFRDQYHPDRVLDAWAGLGRSDIPIVANHEGFYAIRILGSSAAVFRFDNYNPSTRPAPLLVAHDRAEVMSMAVHLGLRPSAYRLLADTGYFEVYLPTAGN